MTKIKQQLEVESEIFIPNRIKEISGTSTKMKRMSYWESKNQRENYT